MTKRLTKSPLNYVGGKYKLLPQILPHFPKEAKTFIDVFAGGGNVFVNVPAELSVINDRQTEVIDLLKYFYEKDYPEIEKEIIDIIKEYGLVKNEKEAYLKLRKDYNDGRRSPAMFYVLICHSFNHQIRFNKLHNFNMPVGLSTFNQSLRDKLKEFEVQLKEGNRIFSSLDFRLVLDEAVQYREPFVYCDPPYLITNAVYNEQGGWTEDDESDLLRKLDELSDKNIKFALSNVLEHKERQNLILSEWSEKYNIIDLNYSYANANYQSTKKDTKTREVLITNY